MKYFEIDKHLDLGTIATLIKEQTPIKLSKAATRRIDKCRVFLDKKLAKGDEIIYGVNTGFGSLCNTIIDQENLEQLQINLLKSHACGMGEEVPQEIVRLMLLLKIQSLAYGHSGVQVDTVLGLIHLYNHQLWPVVYQQGSLGASGDLAPLSHLCLPIIGLGEVYMNGKKVAAIQALKKHNLAPVKLRSKEGLALINGTQFMGAYGAWLLMKGKEMMRWADAIAGLSFEAFDGILAPFDDRIHQIRPHYGQIYTAAFFRQMLKGSKMAAAKKTQVQDPYSFRCIPQVHGATKDVWNHVEGVFNIELNSVTDNPNIFPDDNEVISGGNFHGQVLALALDYLCIAMHELGNISERRIYLLVSGQRGLPPFLAPNAGLNSGFMIPQYTAAGIVSQNKQWCTPASADSIVSSNGQEDHVSMGANAATKAYKVVENLESILSIELLTAAQAFNFRRPATSSKYIEQLHHSFRAEVKFIEEDVYMHEYMQRSLRFIKSHQLPDVKIAKVS